MDGRRRLLVTGSQDWDDFAAVRGPLKKLWDFDPDILMVSGACPRGADLLCETIWDEYLGGGVERHPADWYPDGRYDGMAGINRSERMVRLGAWGCLAFGLPCERSGCRGKKPDPGWPFHVTHGTKACARMAAASGIPVKRYTPILGLCPTDSAASGTSSATSWCSPSSSWRWLRCCSSPETCWSTTTSTGSPITRA